MFVCSSFVKWSENQPLGSSCTTRRSVNNSPQISFTHSFNLSAVKVRPRTCPTRIVRASAMVSSKLVGSPNDTETSFTVALMHFVFFERGVVGWLASGLDTLTPGEGFTGCAIRAGVLKLPEGLISSTFKGFVLGTLFSPVLFGHSAEGRFSTGAMGGLTAALGSTGAEGQLLRGGDGKSIAKSTGDNEDRRRAVPGERGGASSAGNVGDVGSETTGNESWAALLSTAGAGG